MRRRALLLVSIALLLAAVLGGSEWAWRRVPDPYLDAVAFLAPYEEISQRPYPTPRDAPVPSIGNYGTLARKAWFADEEIRLRRMFIPSRGWRLSRVSGRKGVFMRATAFGTSRARWLLNRIPFVTHRSEGEIGVSVELTPRRPDGRGGEPWTTARLAVSGREYPYTIPPTPKGAALPRTQVATEPAGAATGRPLR